MIMRLDAGQTFEYKGAPVKEIVGYQNGSFMLTTEDNQGNVKHYAADNKGSIIKEFSPQQDLEVIMFNDGCYLLFSRHKVTFNGSHTPSSELIGTFYNARNKAIFGTFYGCKVFPNNWYVLSFGAKRTLYNDKHQMVAEWFGRCFAFGDGYYALQNANWLITSLNHCWQLFHNQKKIDNLDRVEDFVGNSCMLIKKQDKKIYLCNLKGKMLNKIPIVSWERFLNNRFVLTFENGIKRMFTPEGKPTGVATKDETILADGRFVTMDRHIITGLYGTDGIVETSCETPTEVNNYGMYYYQLHWFEKNMLFDANGQNLGEDYDVIAAKDNFLLTERAGKICLFNQFGCALVCDK